MRLVWILGLVCWCAAAQKADVKINYVVTQASVQDVAKVFAGQAGLAYDWQKSFDQTNPECRRWVRDARFDDVTFDAAMQQLLRPVGLRYAVESGRVVLYRDEAAPVPSPADVRQQKISYRTDNKSVQYIVIDLAKQVGLGYNWNKSFSQTDPECRRFVNDLSIKEQPFDKAMEKVLKPVGLRYQIEGRAVVLYRR